MPSRIADALAGRELTTAEVYDAVIAAGYECTRQSVRNALSSMVQRGRAVRTERVDYHTHRYALPPAHPIDVYLGLRPMIVGRVRRVCFEERP